MVKKNRLYFCSVHLLFIWVKIIRMGNMHKPCQFLSVSMVTWSQNVPSNGQKKAPSCRGEYKTYMCLFTMHLCFEEKRCDNSVLAKKDEIFFSSSIFNGRGYWYTECVYQLETMGTHILEKEI